MTPTFPPMVRSNNVHKKGAAIAEVEAALIKYIRTTGGLSRIELSKALSLSPSTAGVYVDRLLREGFLLEGTKTAVGVGRPRTTVTLNPKAGQFIGVDFYADEILAVAVDFAQNIVTETRRPIRKTDQADDVIRGIIDIIQEVIPTDKQTLLGIGIGSPGPVDRDRGIAMEYRYIPNFHNIPLVAPVARQFNVPVHIENTANAMALAELWFGQGRDVQDLACLWIRRGIGAGIIVKRQLYAGLSDGAGEIGFWRCPTYKENSNGTWHPDPDVALCELENLSSDRAIRTSIAHAIDSGQQSVLTNLPNALTQNGIVQAYCNNDRLTRNVIDAAASSLGWAIAQLSLCLAPERIILAGPLAELGNDFVRSVEETAVGYFASTGLKLPSIVLSTLGPFSGALGAAALVVDLWKPAR